MNRRHFIENLSASALAFSLAKNDVLAESITKYDRIIKPKVLTIGDTVGVIAPGTSVSDPIDIYRTEEVLNFFGLKMRLGDFVIKGSGYKSRSVNERLKDIHMMFEDDSISGVFCIRGGFGSMELLDKINYDLIKSNPKIFIGYSDITALHLAINKMTGLVTFHGPVLLSSFSNFTIENFRKAIFSNEPLGSLRNPDVKNGFRISHPLISIKSGKAVGKLIGGNLSLVSDTMGTKYEIDTSGKILFIEDVGEEPFRIHRMLLQLKLAGKLQQASGVIFGECSDCNNKSSNVWDLSVNEINERIFQDIDVPVLSGLTIGHTSDQLTIPIGIMAELDADEGILNITESACNER